MSKSACKFLLYLFLLIGFSACAKPTKTGFLDDYSQLSPSPHAQGAYSYFNPNPSNSLGQYSKFIIEPIYAFLTPEERQEISDTELRELIEYFHTQIVLAIGDEYAIVQKPAPGVARVRIAITDIDDAEPILNIHPAMILSGIGLGGACMEGEVLDSETGERIAAVIDCQKGRRGLAGLKKYEQSKHVLKEWAERLRARLDEAHGKQPKAT